MNKAKIFMNGQSQAVRLPKEFRFSAKAVSVIPLGKGIILQPVLKTWREVFDEIKLTGDFFLMEEKICHLKNEIGNYLNDLHVRY